MIIFYILQVVHFSIYVLISRTVFVGDRGLTYVLLLLLLFLLVMPVAWDPFSRLHYGSPPRAYVRREYIMYNITRHGNERTFQRAFCAQLCAPRL